MATVTVKGYELAVVIVKDSFQRRAVQFANKIAQVLRKLGLTEDDMDIPVETLAIKRAAASASWYFEGYHLHYSYQASGRFVDNLAMVLKVIEVEVEDLLSGKKTVDEFIRDFAEDRDVKEQREEARELLGLPEDCIDVEVIDKRYKELAKKYHPDVAGGDAEKFKAINRAHKILKRELQ